MFNTLAHYLVGGVTGAIARRFPTLACILAAGFFLYQSIEMYRKNQLNKESKDNAYPEIRQFLVGFGFGAAAEAADAAVMRGGVGDRLRRWRDSWFRAVGEVVGAAQPAEHRVGNQPVRGYTQVRGRVFVNDKEVWLPALPDTYHVSKLLALAKETGMSIPADPILRRETPDGKTELLQDKFEVQAGDRFVLLDAADNA